MEIGIDVQNKFLAQTVPNHSLPWLCKNIYVGFGMFLQQRICFLAPADLEAYNTSKFPGEFRGGTFLAFCRLFGVRSGGEM